MDRFHLQYALSRARATQRFILHKLEVLNEMKSTTSVKDAIYVATKDLRENEQWINKLENTLAKKEIIKSA